MSLEHAQGAIRAAMMYVDEGELPFSHDEPVLGGVPRLQALAQPDYIVDREAEAAVEVDDGLVG